MICSILLPSRERPNGLKRAVHSVFHTAKDKSNVEVLVRLDNDDPTLNRALVGIKDIPNVQILIGPRRNGYNSVAEFISDLANISQSPWIGIMDDDSYYIQEENSWWDEQLGKIPARNNIGQPEKYWLGATPYNRGETGPIGVIVPNKCWLDWGVKRVEFPHDTFLFSNANKHHYGLYIINGLTYRHEWKQEYDPNRPNP